MFFRRVALSFFFFLFILFRVLFLGVRWFMVGDTSLFCNDVIDELNGVFFNFFFLVSGRVLRTGFLSFIFTIPQKKTQRCRKGVALYLRKLSFRL